MTQYIDKSAVVAEIERRKRKLLDNIICEGDKEWAVRTAHQLNRILLFLDTLEVKGVDLEKENLTWKDIRELYIIFAKIDAEIEFCKTDIQGETIGYYQEALKRLKAQKGGINYGL